MDPLNLESHSKKPDKYYKNAGNYNINRRVKVTAVGENGSGVSKTELFIVMCYGRLD